MSYININERTSIELYLERLNSGDPLRDYYDEHDIQEVLGELLSVRLNALKQEKGLESED